MIVPMRVQRAECSMQRGYSSLSLCKLRREKLPAQSPFAALTLLTRWVALRGEAQVCTHTRHETWRASVPVGLYLYL